jgi:hypothetical protein
MDELEGTVEAAAGTGEEKKILRRLSGASLTCRDLNPSAGLLQLGQLLHFLQRLAKTADMERFGVERVEEIVWDDLLEERLVGSDKEEVFPEATECRLRH